MKKRTFAQLIENKSIYRKHATSYKSKDYPYYRTKRMMAYTSILTKAIAYSSAR